MGNHENLTTIKDLLSELHAVLQDFRVVHKDYNSKIESKNDLHESDNYCLSVEQSVRELEQQIDSWLRDVQHDLKDQSEPNVFQKLITCNPKTPFVTSGPMYPQATNHLEAQPVLVLKSQQERLLWRYKWQP